MGDDPRWRQPRRHRTRRPKGRPFYALLTEGRERELDVDPIDRRVSYRHLKASQVLGIWPGSRAKSGEPVEAVSQRRATRLVVPPQQSQ